MARQRHRGQIISKGRGTWRLRWYLGIDPETGRRRYASKTVHGSRRDAERRLVEIVGLVEKRITVTTRGTTTASMLREWIDDDAAQAKRRERTRTDYRSVIERHIVPKVGAIRLDRLDPTVIESRLTHPLASAGKVRTAKLCRDVLSAACRWAVRAKRYGIDSNPVRGVEVPNGSSRKVGEALTPEQTAAFRNAIVDTPHEALFLLLLGTGMRPSEALALRWSDLDFETGHVHVRRSLVPRSKLPKDRRSAWPIFEQPKTSAGRRSIPLPPTLVGTLRRHRATQAAARLRGDLRADTHDLVFRDRRGGAIDLDNLRARHFKAALRRAGLPESTRLYSLRHSTITAAVTGGADVATVARLAGHSSTRITLDVYTHSNDETMRQASETVASALLGADTR
jgi:integrase